MRCAHCLRGAAQRLDINEQFIDELLRHCDDGIGCLIFSGGEPTLNLNAIEHTLQVIRWRNIPLGGFYVVTNGKVYHRRLTEILDNIYPYCDEPDLCGLAISDDMFHSEFQSPAFASNFQRYQYLDNHYDFEREYFRAKDKQIDFTRTWLLNEGRAKSLSGFTKQEFRDEEICISGNSLSGILYLNAKGYLLDGCNWSYRSQEQKSIAHVSQWEKFIDALPHDEALSYA